MSIKCPKCNTEVELNGINPTATYWVDNDGNFHWECFECSFEWLGDSLGRMK